MTRAPETLKRETLNHQYQGFATVKTPSIRHFPQESDELSAADFEQRFAAFQGTPP